MKKDEVILFKQWDSDLTLTGRCCFHTAFKDESLVGTTPTPRESIEIRAFCFFPDHTPNTCPEFKYEEDFDPNGPVDEEECKAAATKIMTNIGYLAYWPDKGE
jgi:hypothetical protein